MKTVTSIKQFRQIRKTLSTSKLGFVPTMGALHQGHISLLERSVAECDVTVLSIFLNPTQFNNPDDLKIYPITLQEDLEKAAQAGVDVVLLPEYDEIYSDNFRFQVNENNFSKQLCGAHRDGHFTGVLTIVMKLLNIVEAEKAYFGEKDYQQFGFWYREGNIFMHFDEVGQDGSLDGISHYYFDDEQKMTRSLFAKHGTFHSEGDDQTYWQLEDVIVTDFKVGRTEANKIDSLRWDSSLAPELLSTEILVQPDKMSIGELNDKIEYMREQGLNSGKFELGFWKKVLQPLSTIGLVFVAISFIFGPLRESTMGMRVIMGLVIGILFKFVQDLLSPASMVFGFSPIIAIIIPIAICFIVGYPLMRRAS
ncbi:pantoate--beta-alanine ligase [Pseudomonadales bacterium]|nr:pantoate--beta-alanine ligase [Pseudomonadales bacterium]